MMSEKFMQENEICTFHKPQMLYSNLWFIYNRIDDFSLITRETVKFWERVCTRLPR